MAVERLGEGDVGAGVKAIGQLDALIVEVGVDGKALIAAAVGPEWVLAGLGLDTEACLLYTSDAADE